MVQITIIASLLKEWAEEYLQYDAAMKEYSKTSRFIRWFKDIREPRHPFFHSFPIIRNSNVAVELRCYDGLFLACRVGDRAYSLNLQSGEKTPMLGSRGMGVPDNYEWEFKRIADDIHELAFSDDKSHIKYYV